MGLSLDEFQALFPRVKREALHMNMRDSYGTETELPHFARWKAGEQDDFAWLRSWCDLIRDHAAAGRVFRRVNIVSEPLSEYQQWSLAVERPMVAAGQDIRWVSRRLVSELSFPGNDFWLFDDELVVFMHYAGSGLNIDQAATSEASVIKRCRDSFEAVWPLGVPHGEYQPVT
jgi:hypothetical protein